MKTKRTPRSRTRSSASVGEVQGLGPALGSGESFFFSHFPLVRLLVIANLQPNNINVWVWLTKETSSEIYENCPWKQIKPKIPFLLFFKTISYVSILYIRTIRVTTLLTQSAPPTFSSRYDSGSNDYLFLLFFHGESCRLCYINFIIPTPSFAR